MSNIAYDYMENYIRSLIPEDTGILKELEIFAKENKVPIVHKEVANFLSFFCNFKKPENILELGTAIGYSSIIMSLNSPENCVIKTIEKDSDMIKLAEENIKRYNLENRIQVLSGDCIEVIKNLDEKDKKYDIIFLDAGKGHYNHLLPDCLRLLNDDGVIIGDNVLFRGMVASKDLLIRRKITIVKRMKNYLEMVSNDKDLVTSVIPMGDGISITTRRIRNE